MNEIVKFVSFNIENSECPIAGILTLSVDGKMVTFGENSHCDGPRFWTLRGDPKHPDDDHCCGPWILLKSADSRNIPDYISSHVNEIINQMNKYASIKNCWKCIDL